MVLTFQHHHSDVDSVTMNVPSMSKFGTHSLKSMFTENFTPEEYWFTN